MECLCGYVGTSRSGALTRRLHMGTLEASIYMTLTSSISIMHFAVSCVSVGSGLILNLDGILESALWTR